MASITIDTEELGALIAKLGHAESRVQELLEKNGETLGRLRAKLSVNELCRLAHEASKEKGWYEGGERNVPEMLALIHSEVSEALECYRIGHMTTCFDTESDPPDKPEGFSTELADVVIRVADLCGYLEIDLERAIKEKMSFNQTRPHRHGGKAA